MCCHINSSIYTCAYGAHAATTPAKCLYTRQAGWHLRASPIWRLWCCCWHCFCAPTAPQKAARARLSRRKHRQQYQHLCATGCCIMYNSARRRLKLLVKQCHHHCCERLSTHARRCTQKQPVSDQQMSLGNKASSKPANTRAHTSSSTCTMPCDDLLACKLCHELPAPV